MMSRNDNKRPFDWKDEWTQQGNDSIPVSALLDSHADPTVHDQNLAVRPPEFGEFFQPFLWSRIHHLFSDDDMKEEFLTFI